MNYLNIVLKINSDLRLLAPVVADKAQKACEECKAAGHNIKIFEGWRSPERQEALFSKGRKDPGPKVTNAAPFFSLHQFGLAVDVCYIVDGSPSWKGDFDALVPIFMSHGFDRPPSFEKAHFQISNGLSPAMVFQMYQASTTQGIWVAMNLV